MRRKRLAPDVLPILMGYDWRQNNVRELRNVVERMVIAADGDIIGAEHIPPEIRDASMPISPSARTFVERKAEAERRIVVEALERNEWHITRTAADLGLADHASLLKIMRRHGISRD
jgi:DNA-binding NtrC family response regulator